MVCFASELGKLWHCTETTKGIQQLSSEVASYDSYDRRSFEAIAAFHL